MRPAQRRRGSLRLLVLYVFLALAPAARADWTVLLPRTFETHSWIDLYTLYESDDLKTAQRRLTWNDLFLKEKLSLLTTGYFYHPRFLRYRLTVSGALKQENYEQSSLPPFGWRNGHAVEYDARLFFLPEHPYNLELMASRTEPLYREQYGTPANTVATSWGADFRWRSKPWYFHARAGQDGFETAGVETTVRKLTLDGKYVKDFTEGRKITFDARYAPSRLTDTLGYASDMSEASLVNVLESRRLRLFSNVSLNDLTQAGGPTTLRASSRMLSWYEQFTADMPFGLRADLFWRYQDNDSEYGSALVPATTTLSNVHRSGELDLKHQLYESLLTTYILRWDSNTSDAGRSTVLNNALNFAYTKRIDRWRGRLDLGLNFGIGDMENTGQTQVVEELHLGTPVPGAFLVQQPGGDPASVILLARSPVPPYDLVRLTEGLHYTVSVVGNTLEVTVVALPPEFPVPGKYDFRVSYSLAYGEFKARLRSFGQSGSLALWDNLLTTYYSYASLSSDVISGAYPGGGIDSQVFTAGVSYFRGPLRARVEYGNVNWAISPWTGWRGEVQYIGPVGPATNVNGTADFRVRSYQETDGIGGTPAYTEKLFSVSGSVQQFLYARTLSISAGGSYSQISGLSNSRSYTLNANLSWRIGRLDLVGGANYSNSQSQDQTAYAGRTVHQYYYLRLRRVLF